MAKRKNPDLYAVETDVEEAEKKIKKHRRRIRNIILFIIIACAATLLGLFVFFKYKTYYGYKVLYTTERTDAAATKFVRFNGNMVKYSNDGASYIDFSNHLFWNQTYEMQNPRVDVCGNYLTIYDKDGTGIYIMDETGVKGSMETTRPIGQVHIAEQGTIAVLTTETSSCHIQLYDKTGKALAKGEIHIQNSGYPLDIALSDDAQKMAVAMLDVTDGKVKTTIGFYNFGSVGQNEVDNIVGSYSYSGTFIPRIEFVANDRLYAFGDNQLLIFEGTQKPEESAKVSVKKEIRSIFFNADYLGTITENEQIENITMPTEAESISDVQASQKRESENGVYRINIYDHNGKQIMSRNFDLNYSSAEFLENGEICIYNKEECEIFTIGGTKKFDGRLKDDLQKVFSGKGIRDYTFVLSGKTQKVLLQ
ncbi:MAG: hypothetical protein HFG80_14020 [Eubacterium sp.]|jgi:hypothetical protein|nr:hypothetical protein [Eubacterium sp.]